MKQVAKQAKESVKQVLGLSSGRKRGSKDNPKGKHKPYGKSKPFKFMTLVGRQFRRHESDESGPTTSQESRSSGSSSLNLKALGKKAPE